MRGQRRVGSGGLCRRRCAGAGRQCDGAGPRAGGLLTDQVITKAHRARLDLQPGGTGGPRRRGALPTLTDRTLDGSKSSDSAAGSQPPQPFPQLGRVRIRDRLLQTLVPWSGGSRAYSSEVQQPCCPASTTCDRESLSTYMNDRQRLSCRSFASRGSTAAGGQAQCSSKVQQPQRPVPTTSDLHWPADLRQRPPSTFLPLDGKEKVHGGAMSSASTAELRRTGSRRQRCAPPHGAARRRALALGGPPVAGASSGVHAAPIGPT